MQERKVILVVVWRSGSALVSITSGPVSTGMGDRVQVQFSVSAVHLSQYVTSHPGQLSLAFPLRVGATSMPLPAKALRLGSCVDGR